MTTEPRSPASGEPARAAASDVRYRVLSPWTIATWAVLIVLVGMGVAIWLLLAYTGGDADANRVQLDAIRTAGTIVVGTGGAAALLLAARRQRSTEIALKQKDRDQALQERVAATTETDAEARRITDLYTKAGDQLGSDKAPVRLAGLYALERLAQDNPSQRQTIVNVLCAYLRMPFTPPEDEAPVPSAEEKVLLDYRERVQERNVRVTAQRLLGNHLRPGQDKDHPVETFWADINLDLTGATLIDFSLRDCTLRYANCGSATFIGPTVFIGTTFTRGANFPLATFTDAAHFHSVTFVGSSYFRSATFAWDVHFRSATFAGPATFLSATFGRRTHFRLATFTDHANFVLANFVGPAHFESATFADTTHFHGVNFAGNVPKEVEPFWSPPDTAAPGDENSDADENELTG